MIEWLLIPVGLCALLAFLFYIYMTQKFNYFKDRGISGPKPKPLFGNLPNAILQKRNVIYDIDDIYNSYKEKEKFVGIFMTRIPQLLLIDPEVIRDVLVKKFKFFHDNEAGQWLDKKSDPIFGRNPFFANGEEWKEKRSEITPALTTTRLKATYPIVKDICKKLTIYMQEIDKECVNMKNLAERYTMAVIVNCIYGIQSGTFEKRDSSIYEMGKKVVQEFEGLVLYSFMTTIFPIVKMFHKRPLMPKYIEEFFTKLMSDAIEVRRSNATERNDILNYLIQLKDKKNFSDLDMASHVNSFFIDGFETSSIVITHVMHMLARNKSAQECLRKEIEEALISGDGEVNFEKLNELPYLEQCVNETLRLFPPAPALMKLCTQECVLENYKEKQVKIDKGTVINIPIHSVHRDEKYYSQPNEFVPQRFDEELGGIKKYKDLGVFIPFGDGPRICLGIKLAQVQVKAAIVEIISNWKVSLNSKTQRKIVMDAKQFLNTQEGGVWLTFSKIK